MSVKSEDGSIVWKLGIPQAKADENYLKHYFDCQGQYFRMMAQLDDLTDFCVESGMDGLISLIINQEEQERLRNMYNELFEERKSQFCIDHSEITSEQDIPNKELGKIRCRVCTEVVGAVHLWFAQFLNVTKQVEVTFVRSSEHHE